MITKIEVREIMGEKYRVFHSNAGRFPDTPWESRGEKWGHYCPCLQYQKYKHFGPCEHVKDVKKFKKNPYPLG